MCKSLHELQPIVIPAGTPLPLMVRVYFSIGKWPIISVLIKNVDGSTTTAPDVTTTQYYDSDGFITEFSVDDSDGGGGVAADNLLVIIHPQNLSVCAG